MRTKKNKTGRNSTKKGRTKATFNLQLLWWPWFHCGPCLATLEVKWQNFLWLVFKTLETFFLATINSPLTRPQFNSESYLKMCKSCKTDAIKFRYRWYFNFWVFPAISLILAKALFASSNFLGCRSSAQMVCCFTLVLIIETILMVCKISDLWDRSLTFDVVIMTTNILEHLWCW